MVQVRVHTSSWIVLAAAIVLVSVPSTLASAGESHPAAAQPHAPLPHGPHPQPAASQEPTTVTLDPEACSPTLSCARTLQAALDKCAAARTAGCTINFRPGTYDMTAGTRTIALSATGLSKLRLVGLPATGTGRAARQVVGGVKAGPTAPAVTLMMHSLSGFFTVAGCDGVQISGLSLDMARQPYTYGQVVSASADSFTLRVDAKAYPFPLNGTGPEWSWLLGVQAVLQYDPLQQRPSAKGLDVYGTFKGTWDAKDSTYTLSGLGSQRGVEAGQWLILRHQVYSLNGFAVYESTNVELYDVELLSTPGMGVYMQHTTDVLLDRVAVRKALGRPMSITADATHFNTCKGTITVLNSLFEGQGDDGMNIHGKFTDLERISSDRKHVVFGLDGVLAPRGTIMPAVGDQLEFRSRHTMQPYPFTTQLLALATDPTSHITTATLADALPSGVAVYDLVRSLNWSPAAIVRNCTFRDNRARGTLVKTNDVLLQGNTYDHNSGPAVMVDPDGCYWLEAAPVHNWTLRDSSIIGVNYGAASNGGDVFISTCVPRFGSNGVPTRTGGAPPTSGQVHSDVAVVGCNFQQSTSSAAISVTNVDGFTVAHNTVRQLPDTSRAPTNFVTTTCSSVSVVGNSCLSSSGLPYPCTHSGA